MFARKAGDKSNGLLLIGSYASAGKAEVTEPAGISELSNVAFPTLHGRNHLGVNFQRHFSPQLRRALPGVGRTFTRVRARRREIVAG